MITPSQYAAFITTATTTLGHLYSELNPETTHNEWATTLPMQGSIYATAWTGRMPKFRPWFGARVTHEPAMQIYQVEPYPTELTIALDRFVLEDSDVNGQSPFWRTLPDMVRSSQLQPEYELRDLLEGSGIQTGNRQISIDGLSHFSTAHPLDIYNPSFNGGGNALFSGGTYCNSWTGGGHVVNSTTIGGALSIPAFTSLCEYMRVIPGEDGEALGVIPSHLMYPATLMGEANYILQSSFMGAPSWGAFSPISGNVGTTDNTLKKFGVQGICNPYLRNTKNWFLMDCRHQFKPFLFLVRNAPMIVPKISETDENMFRSHQLIFGGWDRIAPAFDFPFLAHVSGP